MKTMSQNNAIQAKVNEIRGRSWSWMGMTDVTTENQWKYSRNNELVGFTNWHSGYPVNRGDCAYIFSGHGEWFDQDCNYKQDFICEF